MLPDSVLPTLLVSNAEKLISMLIKLLEESVYHTDHEKKICQLNMPQKTAPLVHSL